MNTFYLNQSGNRWKNYIGSNPEKVWVHDPQTGKYRNYTVRYWESIGNFAVPYISKKGIVEQLMQWGEGIWAVNSKENREAKQAAR